jgi:hypothetical protein
MVVVVVVVVKITPRQSVLVEVEPYLLVVAVLVVSLREEESPAAQVKGLVAHRVVEILVMVVLVVAQAVLAQAVLVALR